ncbi:STAS domain-containing protein [Chlorogloeopsis sp. ULAP01]|jgi:anti-sigma B factor antagonist|uniref:STAS domain-containing protein n=1 Tax=Chlorogloeopsis sp. ULAP01 TaxID=3056483 RepID=UPI0025AA8250|nr:STAS domain-containing protein [Chlorogloeopsis sp. ULAP01]MDM9383468.1 STAS domain-containing protein [Chlorogloeopsis sp. ULAP01]
MTMTQQSFLKCQMILLQPQNAKALREELAILVPQPYHLWVIDLAQVDFMDSSGLFALTKGLSAARSIGCRLVICNLQPSIQIIFELTQLDSVFEIFESYDAVLCTVNAQS